MDDWIRQNTTELQRLFILAAMFGAVPLGFWILNKIYPTRCPICKSTNATGWHCNDCGWRSRDTAP